METIRWIFFDIGSTLVDETDAYDHRAREMLLGTNISFEAFDAQRIAFAKQGLNGDSEAIKHFHLDKTPWPSHLEDLFSDAEAVLKTLFENGFHLGIIANQNPGTAGRLESWGLKHYFSVIAASAELGTAKPNPEIFLTAMDMAGCTPEEAVMVGDRLDNDILPAKKLGMKTVWMRTGLARYQKNTGADYVVDTLSELLDLFLHNSN